MLRILTEIGATTTTEIEAADIYDPRVNRYWKPRTNRRGETSSLSMAEYMTFIEALYTEENIRAHPQQLLGYISEESLNKLLAAIPPEKHKYLAFFGCSADGYIWCFYTDPRHPYWERTYIQVDEGDFAENKIGPALAQIEAFVIAKAGADQTAMSSICETGTIASLFYYMSRHDLYINCEGDCLSLTQVLAEPEFRVRFGPIGSPPVLVRTSKDGKSHLYKTFPYRTDVTTLITDKIVAERETKLGTKYRRSPGEPLYGIELELTCDHSVKDIINSQEFPFFICKQDTSIVGSCSNAYECVTVPMDRRSQRVAWGKFFASFWDEDEQTYRGFDTSTDTNNGMHVHISKDSFASDSGEKHLRRFTWFFVDPFNNEFITAVSERGDTLGEFAKIPSFTRYTRKQAFNRCIEECALLRGAVNIKASTARTVEVRIFKGIVSYATVLKNLEFTDAVFHFSQEAGYSRLTVENFINWVNDQPKTKYKALKMFLKNLDPGIVTRINLTRSLSHLKTEIEVIKYFSTRQVEVNEHVLEFLNRQLSAGKKRSKPTFAIVDGKIVRNPKIHGVLKDYDKQFNPWELAA